MHASDIRFFEEYKRLDQLCSDLFLCPKGVSTYIAQMEEDAAQGRFRVSSWDSDYKALKHLRWVRNRIAHESGSYQISGPEDLAAVGEFYRRILSGDDPLALLRKAVQRENEWKAWQTRPQANQVRVQPAPSFRTPEAQESNGLGGLLICIGILALILLFFYYC